MLPQRCSKLSLRQSNLKAGVFYFLLVFGVGLILGPIRILWVAPRLGASVAELLEAPIMLVVSVVSARWIIRWLALPPAPRIRLGMGSIALGLMMLAEFTLVLWLREVFPSGSIVRSEIPLRSLSTTLRLVLLP